jgi:nitrate reductase gamma subunit
MELPGASSAYHTGQYLGLAALAALLVVLVRRGMKPHRASRARVTDAVAALVVGALLIGGVVRFGGDTDPWKTDKGAEMKAGLRLRLRAHREHAAV